SPEERTDSSTQAKASRADARMDNVMMQRWLNETPKDQPFSSVGFHAENDKKLR
ncbi:MAG: hypothetical protein LQ338_005593, partial [Usnochroma carphineum]